MQIENINLFEAELEDQKYFFKLVLESIKTSEEGEVEELLILTKAAIENPLRDKDFKKINTIAKRIFPKDYNFNPLTEINFLSKIENSEEGFYFFKLDLTS